VTNTGFSYRTTSTTSFYMCIIFLQKFVALAVMFCIAMW